MSSDLTREQIIDLLEYLGSSKIINKEGKDDIQFNCTVHGEHTPSAGMSIDKQIFHCFSCHASGTISWLVYKSLPEEFKNLKEVDKFLHDRYGIDFVQFDKDAVEGLRRYEDQYQDHEEEKRRELPRVFLAQFKSGKETYQYFYDRGFTKQTVKDFMIGRDILSKTVTVPVFWEDNAVAGVIGRYIDPNRRKNERYKIYEFSKGQLTFPLNKLEVVDDTIILCEGLLDAVWLHQLGFTNAQAILGNGLTKAQAEIIKARCKKVIFMFDNDEGGVTAIDIAKSRLGRMPYYLVDYPEGKKDPQDCTKDEIQDMIDNKYNPLLKKLRRY